MKMKFYDKINRAADLELINITILKNFYSQFILSFIIYLLHNSTVINLFKFTQSFLIK